MFIFDKDKLPPTVYTFRVDEVEHQRAEEWFKKHICEHGQAKYRVYSFVQGSIGTSVVISCGRCGAMENITNLDRW